MKPELVNEERTKEIVSEIFGKYANTIYSREAAERVALECARAILEELGIEYLTEVDNTPTEQARRGGPMYHDVTVSHWMLLNGALLVRAKEKR